MEIKISYTNKKQHQTREWSVPFHKLNSNYEAETPKSLVEKQVS
ncbi:hypothetical protein [Vibrio phage phiKT1024]|nr:hypothetical protein [Vibrio phage phiKT1024]